MAMKYMYQMAERFIVCGMTSLKLNDLVVFVVSAREVMELRAPIPAG
jgi:hypothetical protein